VLRQTRDNEEIIERVAALDIGKAGVVCCLRVRARCIASHMIGCRKPHPVSANCVADTAGYQ
jgi:hypothetical protein